MVLLSNFHVELPVEGAEGAHLVELLPGARSEEVGIRGPGATVGVVALKVARVHHPIVLRLLVDRIEQLEHLPADQLVVTIEQYNNLVLPAVVLDCVIDVKGGELLFLVSDEGYPVVHS